MSAKPVTSLATINPAGRALMSVDSPSLQDSNGDMYSAVSSHPIKQEERGNYRKRVLRSRSKEIPRDNTICTCPSATPTSSQDKHNITRALM